MSAKLYAIYYVKEKDGGTGEEKLFLYSDENGTPLETGTLLGQWDAGSTTPLVRNTTSWQHSLFGTGETTGIVQLNMVNAGTENAYFYFDRDGTRHAFDASELVLENHPSMGAFALFNAAAAAAEELDTDPTAGPEKRYLYYKIVKPESGTETHELKLYTDTHGTPGTTGTLVKEWSWGAAMGHSFNPDETSWTDTFWDNSGTQQVEILKAGNLQDLIRLVYDGETLYFKNPGTVLYGPTFGLGMDGSYTAYGNGQFLPETAIPSIPVKSFLALGQAPELPEHAARKGYVDTEIASAVGALRSSLGTAAVKSTGTGPGNVPVLNESGQLPAAVIPPVAITDVFTAASQEAMLALSTAEKGDVCVRTDINKTFILSSDASGAYATAANWIELKAPTAAGSSLLYGASGTFTGDGSTTTFTLALQDSNGTAVGKEGVIQLYEVGSNNVLTPVETATEVTFVADTSWQVKYAFATAPANGTTYKAVLSLLTPYAQSSNETLVLAAPSA